MNLKSLPEDSLVLHDLRGAKAPLYHSAAGFRDFFRSLLESIATTSQDRRRFLSEARAAPLLLLGTMINSSTVTSESSTWYSSTSRSVSGGLKFHCWRTMSRNERPLSGDHRKTNSCVRFISFSSKTSE